MSAHGVSASDVVLLARNGELVGPRVGEGRSWQRGVRGSPRSPCSKTMSRDNEDTQPAEESPADEKVWLIVPWRSSNGRDLVMVLP